MTAKSIRNAILAVLALPLAAIPRPAYAGDGARWAAWNVETAAQRTLFLPTCTGPYQVSSADLNGDGYPDLIIPCRGELLSPKLKRPANDQLTVYLNPGKGKAWERRDFPVGFGPYHSAIGDLDGDGIPDIAVPNYQANDGRDLAILYGSKDRAKLFEPTAYVTIEGGPFTNDYPLHDDGEPVYTTPGLTSTAIVDVNGDGRPDIVVGNRSVSDNVVLLRNGVARFTNAGSFRPDTARRGETTADEIRDVFLTDIDGDRKPDLVAAARVSNKVIFWRGTGDLAYNKAFVDKRTAEFPGKGPRGIARLPDAIAVIFYNSSEVGIIPLPRP
jgi:hypothetical protein